MKILLKNANVYLPEKIGINDILVEDGKIKSISNKCEEKAKIIDCKNKIICPMFVDGHTHLSLTNIYTAKDLIKSGIGTCIGVMSMIADNEDLKHLQKICSKLQRKNIDTYCLTGAFKYLGDIQNDIISNSNIIGTKTALNSKTKIREESPNFEELTDLSQKTFLAGQQANKTVQVHIHLESTKASSMEELKDKMNDNEVGNLFWIDNIVKEKNLPYSLFKLTHSQKYIHKILEYANKGCYLDYTAINNQYDTRFKDLINAINDNNVDISKISISSDMGSMGNKKYQTNSLLNTLKIFVNDKKIPLEKALLLFTSNPGALINNSCGNIQENQTCKLLILDNNLNINMILNGKKVYKIK